jgi:hypothetical protein
MSGSTEKDNFDTEKLIIEVENVPRYIIKILIDDL